MSKMKKTKKSIPPKGPLEWVYILEGKTMREIYDVLMDGTEYEVEYWEDAGVIEISLPEEGNLDFECSDEEGVYWVTLSSKGYDNAVEAMEVIRKICGGNFEVDA